MQKVINILALLSFVGTASILGAGAYVYLNREAFIESAKKHASKVATEAVAGALPGLLDSAVPKMPKVTGPAISSPIQLP